MRATYQRMSGVQASLQKESNIERAKAQLEAILRILDELGLDLPAIHLQHAIDCFPQTEGQNAPA